MTYRTTHRIGWVTGVESERLSIELDPGATGLVKGGLSGVLPVGSINSYVIVPAGPAVLVGIITAVRVVETPPMGDRPYAAQDALIHRLEAVVIGRFEHGRFRQGVTTYPPLFSPVMPATPAQIESVFKPGDWEPIRLGEVVVAPGVDVQLWANRLLSRHCAILGSTGSGKSCTVTALVDSLLEAEIPYANVLIIDTDGEYAAAFSRETERGRAANAMILGPELEGEGGLFVPHWFMNNEDHLDLLRAAEGVQAPLLQRAIADARLVERDRGTEMHSALFARTACDELRRLVVVAGVNKPQEKAYDFIVAIRDAAGRMAEVNGTDDSWADVRDACSRVDEEWLARPDVWGPLTEDQRALCSDVVGRVDPLLVELLGRIGAGAGLGNSDFDAPSFYSLQELYDFFIPYRLDFESINDERMRRFAAGMMLRLSSLLADTRYNFMTRVPNFDDPLSRFLRLLFGVTPVPNDAGDEFAPWTRAYRDRRLDADASNHLVTVVDMSLVASDVLEGVTALLGRLLLEFQIRAAPRGAVPLVVVLEEAHRYVPAVGDSRSRSVFERIAKEGRKFGLGLVVASQRPAELSQTLLAQCGTLIAHRTVNSSDQDLIRSATPAASREILRQLPALPTQHAIVMGEAAPVPVQVRIRDVSDRPASDDPAFLERWRTEPPDDHFENVVAGWERPNAV